MAMNGISRIVVAVGVLATVCSHAEETEAKQPEEIVVVDKRTQLRVFSVYRTPVVIGRDGNFKQAFVPGGRGKRNPIEDYQSPLPDAGWRSPAFDDAEWTRTRAPVEKGRGQISGRNPGALHFATVNSIICARAKFIVDDPAQAGDLHLALTYVGGAAVYMNGREVTRLHLPDGEIKPDTLAGRYPDDLYITADGKYLLNRQQDMSEDEKQRFQERFRRARDIVIPAALLRKGLNVLSLELHRAPVNEAVQTVTRRVFGGVYRMPGVWAYAALTDLKLTASPGAAVTANVARPKGVQVWNCAPFDTISVNSYGDPGDPGAPIEIDAVRNGSFSGRFVVSSDATIDELKVALSPLRLHGGSAALDGEAVFLRRGRRATPAETSREEHLFDGLDTEVPKTVKAVIGKFQVGVKWEWKYHYGDGAVLPLWITVTPPKDVLAGLYEGTVTVAAQGLVPLRIPVRCTVHDWTLPAPADYRVRSLNIFSPYSLAMHYKVPLWSDEHFKLIER